ncbi:GntR family transcriptional regulator, partial [Klebsiella pneumoniae]
MKKENVRSRSPNLRHNVINQVINDMARGFIPSPLPSQSALAEMYNISRTTVRHI